MMDKDMYENMKKLQLETQAGMFWCRRVLEKFINDYNKALEYLRAEGFEEIKKNGLM